jgi:hypothetical protein
VSAKAEKAASQRTVNTVGSSACSEIAEFEVGLWKACGIENRSHNFFKQIPGGRFDRESDLGFKWLSSNQLSNSHGINMQLGASQPESARF